MSYETEIRPRLLTACFVGLIVTAAALNTVPMGSNFIGYPQASTRRRMKNVAAAIEKYRQQHHALPRSLAQLGDAMPVRDYWGRSMLFFGLGRHYRVLSLGADGKVGGTGLDCDLSNDNPDPPEAQIPFRQLLRHPALAGMVWVSFLSGLMAAVLTFVVVQPSDFVRWGYAALTIKLVVTLGFTILVATFITILHIPNGH